MKIYWGRIEPYTEADYLAAGETAEMARTLAGSHPPRTHLRVYVEDTDDPRAGQRLLEPPRRGSQFSGGFFGEGPRALTEAIVHDLYGDDVQLEPEVFGKVEQLLAQFDSEADFQLPEWTIRAGAPPGTP